MTWLAIWLAIWILGCRMGTGHAYAHRAYKVQVAAAAAVAMLDLFDMTLPGSND